MAEGDGKAGETQMIKEGVNSGAPIFAISSMVPSVSVEDRPRLQDDDPSPRYGVFIAAATNTDRIVPVIKCIDAV